MGVPLNIRHAEEGDIHAVATLFDAYRQFYNQPPDYHLAEAFIRDRLANQDSVVFLAEDADSGEALGFAQIYPSFSSVSARSICILNDLYVVPGARKRGVGRALLDCARDHAVATGASRLVLSTAESNLEARALYESYGYVRDNVFLTYSLEL